MAVYHVLLAYRLKRIEPTRTVIAAVAAIDPRTVATAIPTTMAGATDSGSWRCAMKEAPSGPKQRASNPSSSLS
jgi:hypothetical protein